MYTIGQIANILGISRDKLRYYEEKGILVPRQNKENKYREYDLKDIDTILAIEFYRSLDLGFKTIQRLHKQSDLNEIQKILDKKHHEVENEIKRLKYIVERIEKVKKGCHDIKNQLNTFSIKPMKSIKILGEISDFRAYHDFDLVHENRVEDSIVKSLTRYVTFNDSGILSSKMFITKQIEANEKENRKNILKFDQCVYTIVEDSVGKDVMKDTFVKSKEFMDRNQYQHQGVAIITMLLMAYENDHVKSYLEVYIPID